MRDVIIRTANIKPRDVVLDIGCGTGFLSLGVSKALGKSGKVLCFDISEEIMKKAKENLSNAGYCKQNAVEYLYLGEK